MRCLRLLLLCAPVLSAILSGAALAPSRHLAAAARLPRSARRAGAAAMEGFSLGYLRGTWERLTDLRVARASHILLKGWDDATVQQMEEWKALIANDESKFAEYASTYSVCPSKKKGGDLGFFTRGKMVKEFDSIVFSTEPGAVVGPVRTDFGHHLIFIHSCRMPK